MTLRGQAGKPLRERTAGAQPAARHLDRDVLLKGPGVRSSRGSPSSLSRRPELEVLTEGLCLSSGAQGAPTAPGRGEVRIPTGPSRWLWACGRVRRPGCYPARAPGKSGTGRTAVSTSFGFAARKMVRVP